MPYDIRIDLTFANVHDIVVYIGIGRLSGYPDRVMMVILENIIPDDCTLIKCPVNIAIAGDQHTPPFIVMAVIVLNDCVLTEIVTVKPAGIRITFIIDRITGLVELPEGIVAVVGIGSVSCGLCAVPGK